MGSGTRPFTLSSWVLVVALLGINLLSSEICSAKDHDIHNTSALLVRVPISKGIDNYRCAPSSCGNIQYISYPFRLNSDPEYCGHSRFTLHCDNNVTVLHLYSGKYLVLALNHGDATIRVIDPGLEKNNCSSIPRYPLSNSNFSYLGDLYYWPSQPVTFIKCANPVSSSLYVVTAPCINNLGNKTGYVKVGSTTTSDLEDGCSIEWTTMMSKSEYKENYQNFSYRYIHYALMHGFELNYGSEFIDQDTYSQVYRSGRWQLMEQITIIFVSHFVVKFILGAPFVIAVLIYKWRKRHSSMYNMIEDFLHSDNNFLPIRCSDRSYSTSRTLSGPGSLGLSPVVDLSELQSRVSYSCFHELQYPSFLRALCFVISLSFLLVNFVFC